MLRPWTNKSLTDLEFGIPHDSGCHIGVHTLLIRQTRAKAFLPNELTQCCFIVIRVITNNLTGLVTGFELSQDVNLISAYASTSPWTSQRRDIHVAIELRPPISRQQGGFGTVSGSDVI
jgi:hypothetical protein